MRFEEEVKQTLESDPEWLDIPYRLAVLYLANLVKDPVKVKEYIHRRIPPEQAGNDYLGLPNNLEEKFEMLGI